MHESCFSAFDLRAEALPHIIARPATSRLRGSSTAAACKAARRRLHFQHQHVLLRGYHHIRRVEALSTPRQLPGWPAQCHFNLPICHRARFIYVLRLQHSHRLCALNTLVRCALHCNTHLAIVCLSCRISPPRTRIASKEHTGLRRSRQMTAHAADLPNVAGMVSTAGANSK